MSGADGRGRVGVVPEHAAASAARRQPLRQTPHWSDQFVSAGPVPAVPWRQPTAARAVRCLRAAATMLGAHDRPAPSLCAAPARAPGGSGVRGVLRTSQTTTPPRAVYLARGMDGPGDRGVSDQQVSDVSIRGAGTPMIDHTPFGTRTRPPGETDDTLRTISNARRSSGAVRAPVGPIGAGVLMAGVAFGRAHYWVWSVRTAMRSRFVPDGRAARRGTSSSGIVPVAGVVDSAEQHLGSVDGTDGIGDGGAGAGTDAPWRNALGTAYRDVARAVVGEHRGHAVFGAGVPARSAVGGVRGGLFRHAIRHAGGLRDGAAEERRRGGHQSGGGAECTPHRRFGELGGGGGGGAHEADDGGRAAGGGQYRLGGVFPADLCAKHLGSAHAEQRAEECLGGIGIVGSGEHRSARPVGHSADTVGTGADRGRGRLLDLTAAGAGVGHPLHVSAGADAGDCGAGHPAAGTVSAASIVGHRLGYAVYAGVLRDHWRARLHRERRAHRTGVAAVQCGAGASALGVCVKRRTAPASDTQRDSARLQRQRRRTDHRRRNGRLQGLAHADRTSHPDRGVRLRHRHLCLVGTGAYFTQMDSMPAVVPSPLTATMRPRTFSHSPTLHPSRQQITPHERAALVKGIGVVLDDGGGIGVECEARRRGIAKAVDGLQGCVQRRWRRRRQVGQLLHQLHDGGAASIVGHGGHAAGQWEFAQTVQLGERRITGYEMHLQRHRLERGCDQSIVLLFPVDGNAGGRECRLQRYHSTRMVAQQPFQRADCGSDAVVFGTTYGQRHVVTALKVGVNQATQRTRSAGGAQRAVRIGVGLGSDEEEAFRARRGAGAQRLVERLVQLPLRHGRMHHVIQLDFPLLLRQPHRAAVDWHYRRDGRARLPVLVGGVEERSDVAAGAAAQRIQPHDGERFVLLAAHLPPDGQAFAALRIEQRSQLQQVLLAAQQVAHDIGLHQLADLRVLRQPLALLSNDEAQRGVLEPQPRLARSMRGGGRRRFGARIGIRDCPCPSGHRSPAQPDEEAGDPLRFVQLGREPASV
eukprot:ctg_94.g67